MVITGNNDNNNNNNNNKSNPTGDNGGNNEPKTDAFRSADIVVTMRTRIGSEGSLRFGLTNASTSNNVRSHHHLSDSSGDGQSSSSLVFMSSNNRTSISSAPAGMGIADRRDAASPAVMAATFGVVHRSAQSPSGVGVVRGVVQHQLHTPRTGVARVSSRDINSTHSRQGVSFQCNYENNGSGSTHSVGEASVATSAGTGSILSVRSARSIGQQGDEQASMMSTAAGDAPSVRRRDQDGTTASSGGYAPGTIGQDAAEAVGHNALRGRRDVSFGHADSKRSGGEGYASSALAASSISPSARLTTPPTLRRDDAPPLLGRELSVRSAPALRRDASGARSIGAASALSAPTTLWRDDSLGSSTALSSMFGGNEYDAIIARHRSAAAVVNHGQRRRDIDDDDDDDDDDPALRAAIAASLVSAGMAATTPPENQFENNDNNGFENQNGALSSEAAEGDNAGTLENNDETDNVDDDDDDERPLRQPRQPQTEQQQEIALTDEVQVASQPSLSSPQPSENDDAENSNSSEAEGENDETAIDDEHQHQHQQQEDEEVLLNADIEVENSNIDDERQLQHQQHEEEETLLDADVELVPQAPPSPTPLSPLLSLPDSPLRSSATGPTLCGVPVAKPIIEGEADAGHDLVENDGNDIEPHDSMMGLISADIQAVPTNDSDPSMHSHFNYFGHDVVVATQEEDPEQGQAQSTALDVTNRSSPPQQPTDEFNSLCPSVVEENPPKNVVEYVKRHKGYFWGGIVLALAVVGIVGYTLGNRNSNDNEDGSVEGRPTSSNIFDPSTSAPVPSPTMLAPTTNHSLYEVEAHSVVFQFLEPFLSTLGGGWVENIFDHNIPTPQHKAVHWMEENSFGKHDHFDLSPWVVTNDNDVDNENTNSSTSTLPLPAELEERLIQRYVLAVFYYSTGGNSSGWVSTADFLSEKHECEWSSLEKFNLGIECNSNKRVIEINMDGNKLSGTIPQHELHGLSYLQKLDLSHNFNIAGPLPDDLGMLPNLRTLLLGHNSLTGTFPASYSNLTALEEVNLEGNQLIGSIPSEVSRMTSLSNIWLSENRFKDGMNNFCQADPTVFVADCLCMNFPQLLPEVKCSCCTVCCTQEGAKEKWTCQLNTPCAGG